jgi:hypothetical protein
MADRLRCTLARMERDGVEPRSEYRVDRAARIVKAMKKIPRTYASLLSLETCVVEEFARFAVTAHEIKSAPRRARTIVEPGLQLLHNLRCRLARSYGGQSYTELVNLILVAASAGLSWQLESQGAIRIKVVASELVTGREISEYSLFSYAIPRC